MFRDIVIRQIMIDYRMTRKDAEKYYRMIDEDMKKEFYSEAIQSSAKAFYED